jgi:acetate kinase
VHGGTEITAPVHITPEVVAAIDRCAALAPLHNPHNLAPMETLARIAPDVPQFASFDTSFHATNPEVATRYAIPKMVETKGIRRYGFHGLSYDYIAGKLARDFKDVAQGAVIVAHLGNGASLCAMRDGRSVGSTMGFSALDGMPMGTRCGQLDPGVILHFLAEGMDVDEITTLLYKESGLKGLSGLSHDMRTLLGSDLKSASEAVDYYVFRLTREIGAMAAVLGGIDALVFTGGIGENSSEIRARALEPLGFLGLAVDPEANAANATGIGAGAVPVLVLPTDEERVIARATAAALSRAGSGA